MADELILKGKTQTIRKWFDLLIEPYRSQAIENCIAHYTTSRLEKSVKSLARAVDEGINWGVSPQGASYWLEVHTKPSDFVLGAGRLGIRPEFTTHLSGITKFMSEAMDREVKKENILAYTVSPAYNAELFLDTYLKLDSNKAIRDLESRGVGLTKIMVTPQSMVTVDLPKEVKVFTCPEMKVIYMFDTQPEKEEMA